ncbi:hypothetical protein AALO_G00294240 [Alosa alosa]|uniref:Uncharacterized protein n=1 Tax=Alosa alosa TaxID=278164 RepID=A0AAV6FCU2_9TELE|nr:hypothetical protein AALO_G00294240 [Alosa alosa]
MPEQCAAYSCSNWRTIANRARGITFHKTTALLKDYHKRAEQSPHTPGTEEGVALHCITAGHLLDFD